MADPDGVRRLCTLPSPLPPPPPRIRPVGFFTAYTNSKILTMIGWRIPTLYEVFVIQLSCNMSWLIWAITKKTIKGFSLSSD